MPKLHDCRKAKARGGGLNRLAFGPLVARHYSPRNEAALNDAGVHDTRGMLWLADCGLGCHLHKSRHAIADCILATFAAGAAAHSAPASDDRTPAASRSAAQFDPGPEPPAPFRCPIHDSGRGRGLSNLARRAHGALSRVLRELVSTSAQEQVKEHQTQGQDQKQGKQGGGGRPYTLVCEAKLLKGGFGAFDFWVLELGLAVEVDGQQHDGGWTFRGKPTTQQWERDRAKDAASVAAGLVVLRLHWADEGRWEEAVREAVREAAAGGGPEGRQQGCVVCSPSHPSLGMELDVPAIGQLRGKKAA